MGKICLNESDQNYKDCFYRIQTLVMMNKYKDLFFSNQIEKSLVNFRELKYARTVVLHGLTHVKPN